MFSGYLKSAIGLPGVQRNINKKTTISFLILSDGGKGGTMEERSFDELIDATCPSCRHAVSLDASVCPNCGYTLKADVKKTPAVQAKAPSAPKVAKPGKSKRAYLWGGIIIVVIIIIIVVAVSVKW
jgi:ssDNA-binding Zn-finger/Zn-ribbon topoisomerase 1